MNIWQRLALALAIITGKQIHTQLDEGVVLVKVNAVLTLTDGDGNVLDRREAHNLVVSAGKVKLLDIATPSYFKDFKYMAIGTSNTAPAVGQTALVGTELARTSAITPTNPTTTSLKFSGSFAAGVGTGTVEELAMLDAASVGTMLNRLLTGTMVKGASDTLTVDLTFTIS